MKTPSRLAIRIYVVVLAQFLVVAAALELGRRAMQPAPFAETQAGYVAEDVARVWDEPPARDAELARAAQMLRWTLELRDPSGRVLARAAHRGPPMPIA